MTLSDDVKGMWLHHDKKDIPFVPPELEPGSYKFEEQIHLQRWLISNVGIRWIGKEYTLEVQGKIQKFLDQVFDHYRDLGVRFTLHSGNLRGLRTRWDEQTHTSALDPWWENDGPIRLEVKELPVGPKELDSNSPEGN